MTEEEFLRVGKIHGRYSVLCMERDQFVETLKLLQHPQMFEGSYLAIHLPCSSRMQTFVNGCNEFRVPFVLDRVVEMVKERLSLICWEMEQLSYGFPPKEEKES